MKRYTKTVKIASKLTIIRNNNLIIGLIHNNTTSFLTFNLRYTCKNLKKHGAVICIRCYSIQLFRR